MNSGVALASGLSLVVHEMLAEPQIAQWGWRIGFLFGGLMGLVSFWLRLSLHETPEFQLLRKNAAKRPFVELMRSHPAQVVVGISSMIATAGFNGLLFAMPAFLPRVMGYSAVEAIQAQNICLVILSFGLLGSGVARRPHTPALDSRHRGPRADGVEHSVLHRRRESHCRVCLFCLPARGSPHRS